MVNQGDVVGNRKGLVFKVTQNGETLPWGTPCIVVGIVALATILLLSGRAFSGSLGPAGKKASDGQCVLYLYLILYNLVLPFTITFIIIIIIIPL